LPAQLAIVDVPEQNLDFPDRELDPRYLRLVEMGFDAVPALINHLDDDRLTRSNGNRVRERVDQLLSGLAGDDSEIATVNRLEKEVARAWWDKVKKRGEEAQLLAQVLPKDNEWPRSQLLRVLLKKYPLDLLKVYRTLLDERPDMHSWALAHVLTLSTIPRQKKVEALMYAGRHKSLDHRFCAAQELRNIDEAAFVEILEETLDNLPKSPKGEYWMCREGYFAALVGGTGNPRAWRALEKAAKRSDVGLRMELIGQLCRSGAKHSKELLAFLSAFLDDETLRDMNSDPRRFEGFPAGDDFARLEVRNYAALEIGRLLKLKSTPEPTWNDQQWAQFRAEVRKALGS
jgi:hypothetical protein